MIVISGALVLVALVLLVIGIVGTELGFVYASIGVSLVSLVFLVIGILQRRGETLPSPAVTPAPPATVEDPAGAPTAAMPSLVKTTPPPVAASADEELETGGTVLVVAGRPRYHVAGCRYLTGKDAEAVDVLDAREEGFTPCGVCKPDDALQALAAEEAQLEDAQPQVEVEPDLEPEPVEASAPTRVARTVTSRKATAPAKAPARSARTRAVPAVDPLPEAPVEVEPLEVTPVEAAPAPTRGSRAAKAVTPAATRAAAAKAATKAPAKAPARKAPSKAAVAAVDSTPAAATATRAGQVVVIPDRGRFHRAECRYVRGVEGAEVLSKTAATRQGYDACGVCKP